MKITEAEIEKARVVSDADATFVREEAAQSGNMLIAKEAADGEASVIREYADRYHQYGTDLGWLADSAYGIDALHYFIYTKLAKDAKGGTLRTQLTIAPNFFSKLTKLKTKFGNSCSKEWVNTILQSIYHPVLCISYLVFALVFLENLTFGLRFG